MTAPTPKPGEVWGHPDDPKRWRCIVEISDKYVDWQEFGSFHVKREVIVSSLGLFRIWHSDGLVNITELLKNKETT